MVKWPRNHMLICRNINMNNKIIKCKGKRTRESYLKKSNQSSVHQERVHQGRRTGSTAVHKWEMNNSYCCVQDEDEQTLLLCTERRLKFLS